MPPTKAPDWMYKAITEIWDNPNSFSNDQDAINYGVSVLLKHLANEKPPTLNDTIVDIITGKSP